MKKYITAFHYFVGFVCLFSLCAVDSDGWWALILFVASSLYLGVLAWRKGKEMEEAE